jgi:hypothetical protein
MVKRSICIVILGVALLGAEQASARMMYTYLHSGYSTLRLLSQDLTTCPQCQNMRAKPQFSSDNDWAKQKT